MGAVSELMKWATTTFIFKMWDLKLKRIKRLAGHHKAKKGHSQDLKPGPRSHSSETKVTLDADLLSKGTMTYKDASNSMVK